MSAADTAEQPPSPSAILSSLPPLPTATASLLALSSRISALEQSLSFEAASSPPLSVHLPPLPQPSPTATTPAASSTATSASTTTPTTASASSRKSRDSSSLPPSASPPPPPSLSFLAALEELSRTLQAVENDGEVRRFLSLHAQVEALLSSGVPLSSFLSSSSLKQQLLLSHYEAVLSAERDLQAIVSLLPSLSPPPLSVSSAQLTAVEGVQRQRLVEVAQLHVTVDRFIAAFDSAVHQLNAALLAFDRRLRTMERSIDQLQPTQQPSA